MLSLILPTYNESESLRELIPRISEALKDIPHEIIVVDDDSPDRTWEMAQELSHEYGSVRVIRRVGRRGLSSAVIEGFLSATGSVLAVCDADGQHDTLLLPALYNSVLNTKGVAIGSRYIEGGSVGEWDERRHTLSRLATGLAVKLCKVRVKDPMSGFFAIDRSLFERTFRTLNPKGFKILLDLLIHVPKDTKVEELPFTFGKRTHGESKLSRRVQIEFIEYLYDSAFGRFIPLTLLKYCIVGAIGVVVHLSVYFGVSRILLGETQADLPNVSLPLLAGIEAAIIFNFLLNNSWTFATVKLRGMRAITGFLTFNIACLIGALANYGVTYFLYARGSSEIASLVIGAAIGMVWNYTMSRLITWRV